MKVVYYTSSYFFDTAIEIINILKAEVELHVLVEVTPSSRAATILNIPELPGKAALLAPEKLLSPESMEKMASYFSGIASIYFVIHPSEKGIGLSTWKASQLALSHVRKIKPDIIHLDAKSLRFITMGPYLYFFKRVYTTIHDPQPHSGEDHIKARLIRFLSLGVAKHYFFFSEFARNEFKKLEPSNTKKTWQLRLFPINFFRKYLKEDPANKTQILFFGRLSPYKGIDVLLEAIPQVLAKYPNEQFVIAGRSIEGYELDSASITKWGKNIVLLNRYISNEELADLFSKSKMVVCPYKDATQSGVLATALALNVPVVASNAGAFPEYINNQENGVIVPVNDSTALATAINSMLANNEYSNISDKIRAENAGGGWRQNLAELLKAYNHR
jgi:glycosyltransferase involved in cell wall biosynthesis